MKILGTARAGAEKLLSTTELSNATYGSFSRSGVRVDLKGFFESKSGQVLIHKLVAPANGEAELPPLPRRWYVGALNDGKFIVDTPPSPCGTDIPPDWGTPPELVLNVVALSLEQAREICDAHNAAIAALQQPGTPALPEVTDDDVATAWDVLLITTDSWSGGGDMRKVLESYRARLMAKVSA